MIYMHMLTLTAWPLTDNAVYFANEEPHCSHSAILDTTQTLTGSEECHEVEHTYEYAVINSINELPHYAELESLQDVVSGHCCVK